MCHFGGITVFLLSGSNFFFTPILAKDFFPKSCKTPKTAKNWDTMEIKVVELGILIYMQPFKIWKNEKKKNSKIFVSSKWHRKKNLWPKKSKIEFDTSKWRARWVDYDYGLFFSFEKFLGHFWSIFWSGLTGGLIGPIISKISNNKTHWLVL